MWGLIEARLSLISPDLWEIAKKLPSSHIDPWHETENAGWNIFAFWNCFEPFEIGGFSSPDISDIEFDHDVPDISLAHWIGLEDDGQRGRFT